MYTLSGTVTNAAQQNLVHGHAVDTILQQIHARQREASVPQLRIGNRMSRESISLSTLEASNLPTPNSAITSTADDPNTTISGEDQYHSSIFKLDISRFRKNACTAYCSCQCHRRMRRRSPSIINRFLGSLFVGYSSLPFWSIPCDQATCTQRSAFSATVTYHFPAWFWEKMLSIVLMTTPFGDTGAVIKLRKISPQLFHVQVGFARRYPKNEVSVSA